MRNAPAATCHVPRDMPRVSQEKNTQTKLALQLREELAAVRQDLSKEKKQRAEAERVRGATARGTLHVCVLVLLLTTRTQCGTARRRVNQPSSLRRWPTQASMCTECVQSTAFQPGSPPILALQHPPPHHTLPKSPRPRFRPMRRVVPKTVLPRFRPGNHFSSKNLFTTNRTSPRTRPPSSHARTACPRAGALRRSSGPLPASLWLPV